MFIFQVQKQESLKRQEKKSEVAATLQPTLRETLHKAKPYNQQSEQYKSISRKLAVFVAVGNVPNSIVECDEFRDLIKELDERYSVPGRTAIASEMDKLFIDLKTNMRAVLSDARKVAITTDIWSKKGLTASYLGLTAHFFLKKDHHRHCLTLAVRRFPSPHTADKVEQMVCEILEEWGISHQQMSVILTDNGSNLVAAFQE